MEQNKVLERLWNEHEMLEKDVEPSPHSIRAGAARRAGSSVTVVDNGAVSQLDEEALIMESVHEESLWDARDVGRFLRVSRSWVYQRAESGLLPCLRVGGLLRFEPAAIRAFARRDPRGE